MPEGPVAIGIGGVLYGVTWNGGSYGFGTVFSLTPPGSAGGTWIETVLYSFRNASDGGNPWTGLVIGPDGVLDGMVWTGGAYNYGTVFSLKPPAISGSQWVETVLHSFAGGTDGADPYYEGGLVMGSGRVLYGTTNSGGTYNQGVLFSLTPPTTLGGAWTESVLYSFDSNSGEPPNGGLVVGGAGALYGTTSTGGRTQQSSGTIFRLAPPSSVGAWQYTRLYSFPANSLIGTPLAGVVIGSGGCFTAQLRAALLVPAASCFRCFHRPEERTAGGQRVQPSGRMRPRRPDNCHYPSGQTVCSRYQARVPFSLCYDPMRPNRDMDGSRPRISQRVLGATCRVAPFRALD